MPPGKPEQLATRAVFFLPGLLLAAWAPLVPLVKAKLDLNDAQLGGLLLCLGLGSIIAMPISGGLAARFGCRRVIVAGLAVVFTALPQLAWTSSVPVAAVLLMLVGAGIGVVDVVMNIQAVIVEKAAGRPLMSGFHGFFSVGGIFGAGIVTAILTAQLQPVHAALAVVALSLLILVPSTKHLLPYGSEEASPPFALPKGRIVLIGALCFILFLAEGSVLDWSAILLDTVHQVPTKQAGYGYIAFAIAMTLGRLTGDRVVAALGGLKIIIFGGITAALGFALAAYGPTPLLAGLGFILVGLGASNVVPVLFTAAGNQREMPANLAIASITTMGYTGILAGPAFLGFLSHSIDLRTALAFVATLLLLVAVAGKTAISPSPTK